MTEIFFEIDSHLSLHNSQAATNDAFVVDLANNKSSRIKKEMLTRDESKESVRISPNLDQQFSEVLVALGSAQSS
jgi:hypothetical protein